MKKLAILMIIVMVSVSSCSRLIQWQWKMRGVSEEGRRTTFEETKSFNEGKEQDLIRYRLQYLRAESDVEKRAIASTIRMMFADYDEEMLQPELREFLADVKYYY